MKKLLGLFCLFTIIVISSCTPGGPGTGTTTGSISDPTAVLKSIPDMDVKLPSSLGGDAAMKMKMKMKMKGITETFSPASLSDVRSQSWMDMALNIRNGSEAAKLLDFLKGYASNNTIVTNTAITSKYTAGNTANITNRMFKFIIKIVSASQTDVYITAIFDVNDIYEKKGWCYYTAYVYAQIIKNDSGNISVKSVLHYVIPATYSEWAVISTLDNWDYFSCYDASTLTAMYGITDDEYPSINVSYSESDGSVSYFSKDVYSSETHYYIAWGDSVNGGVLKKDKWGAGEQPYGRVATEFYNSAGSLIFKNEGYHDISIYNWMDGRTNGRVNMARLGFTTPPATFRMTQTNDGLTYYNIVSNSANSPVVSTSSGYEQDYYFCTGSAFASGDCLYLCTGVDYFVGKTVYIYSKDATLPAAKTYCGDTFYMENIWPLKYVALDTSFSNFAITRTNTLTTSRTNIYDGESGEKITNVYTWNDYIWWLDESKNLRFDFTNDIKLLNLSQEDVWIWDSENYTAYKESGLFIKGTEDKPMYFNFTQADKVNTTLTKLEAVYANKASSFDLAAYLKTLPAVPAATDFPAAQ